MGETPTGREEGSRFDVASVRQNAPDVRHLPQPGGEERTARHGQFRWAWSLDRSYGLSPQEALHARCQRKPNELEYHSEKVPGSRVSICSRWLGTPSIWRWSLSRSLRVFRRREERMENSGSNVCTTIGAKGSFGRGLPLCHRWIFCIRHESSRLGRSLRSHDRFVAVGDSHEQRKEEFCRCGAKWLHLRYGWDQWWYLLRHSGTLLPSVK